MLASAYGPRPGDDIGRVGEVVAKVESRVRGRRATSRLMNSLTFGSYNKAFAPAATAPTVHRRLLFFGIVRPYKGLDVLLRALAAGPDDVALRVVGEFWGGTGTTEALIDELGLRDRVELRPGYAAADEVPALFADCDALALPYRTATGSQAVWMAYEFGVPVVVTTAGRLADDVRPGVDGLVVPPDDVAALAQALREFYEPGVPERLRAAVRPVDPDPYWERYLHLLLSS